MSESCLPSVDTGDHIRRLRAAGPSRGRDWHAYHRVRVGAGDVAMMLLTGLFLGGVFFAGTLGWANSRLFGAAAPAHAAPPPRIDADPYVEARFSREILDEQAAPPPAVEADGMGGAPPPRAGRARHVRPAR